jgi:hypothetical protein
MANANDEKILGLRKQIEEKKSKLKGAKKKFVPITNCSLEIDGVRFNLNVLPKEQLISLLVKLNIYKLSISDLKLIDYTISGYKVDDWMTDIKSKLEISALMEEERKLHEMEVKLEMLLSDDKKIELEIGEIESLLGDK